MNQIQRAIGIISAVLGALVAGGVNIGHVPELIAKLSALASTLGGLAKPADVETAIADVLAAAGAAVQSGVINGADPSVAGAISVLNKFASTLHDFESGQAAVITQFKYEGKDGLVIAVERNSALAKQLLGL